MQALLAARNLRLYLDDGAGKSHFGACGQKRIQILVKSTAWSDHLEVGVAGQGAQTAAEFVERGLVYGLHGHSERDAENDRHQGKQG